MTRAVRQLRVQLLFEKMVLPVYRGLCVPSTAHDSINNLKFQQKKGRMSCDDIILIDSRTCNKVSDSTIF